MKWKFNLIFKLIKLPFVPYERLV